MHLGLRTYFRCTLLNLEAEMKPGMQKWELPDKKQKRVSEQKRDFCSNDENLCKWLGDRINLSNTLEGNLPEEWGLPSRGEIWGTQLTAPTSRHISEGHDYFTYLFKKKYPICQGFFYCLFVNFLAMPHAGRTFPDQGLKLFPQPWKCSLSYGTARKSPGWLF